MIKILVEVLNSKGEPEGRNKTNGRNYFRRGTYKAIRTENLVMVERNYKTLCGYNLEDKTCFIEFADHKDVPLEKAIAQCREWFTENGYKEIIFKEVTR